MGRVEQGLSEYVSEYVCVSVPMLSRGLRIPPRRLLYTPDSELALQKGVGRERVRQPPDALPRLLRPVCVDSAAGTR